MKTIDMRSDTVTHPTPEMRSAMAGAAVGDDVYGDDPTTLQLEALGAELAGKEAALFVPSGTFGNQLALFTHCHSGEEVILYDDCHIVQHEAAAAATISRVQLRTLPGPGSEPDAARIESKIRTDADDVHQPRTGLICIENAHSNGRVISLAQMQEVRRVAGAHGIPVHMDGARLFNAASYLGVPAAEVAQCADSVMFCLSKGLCAPIGSLLAGSASFIQKARRRRKLLGGGMRQTGIVAAAGLIALQSMVARLAEDRQNAVALAQRLAAIPGLHCQPETVHANLVFFTVETPAQQRLLQALAENGILANPPENGEMRLATHYWVSAADVQHTADVVEMAMAGR